jgi:uncharacterized membrane protein YvbJ
MAKRGNKKFCPKCGTTNEIDDAYCIKCGYNFKKRNKSKINPIIIILIILIVAWIFWRTFSNKSLIPTEIIDLVKNITSIKLGQK